MKLTNRDAMAYALYRWFDIGGRRITFDDAQAAADEILSVCPPVMRLAAAREWKSGQSGRSISEPADRPSTELEPEK